MSADSARVRLRGLISFNVLFQSKRYKGNIGPDTVRDFRGAMVGRADKGVLISTGGFTLEARREATRDGAPPIDLIDGRLYERVLSSTWSPSRTGSVRSKRACLAPPNAFADLTEIYQIESDLKAKVASAFDEMIARAGGVPPALSA